MLHVSAQYRRMGLGRALFGACTDKAREWGKAKLYISANPAEESIAFYLGRGCTPAQEVSQEHLRHDPTDIQLEYVL
jgi:GNAT superfamily N-acetyltransferase